MKIKTRYIGLILTGVGIISISILVLDYETVKIDKLSQKIDSLLMLVPNCNYSYEKSTQIERILYDAKTKLIIENNYDSALLLTNLAVGKSFSCQQGAQIVTPHLILFPMSILMILFGLALSIRKPIN